MFKKILIANRGEIACRIIRTAKRMGINTVAIYSEADAYATHVSLADQAILIGPAPAAESYLSIERILDGANRKSVDAIHPGYGFLSESVDFAEHVRAAGMVFIGPPSSAIREMGVKDQAKVVMEKAGIPVIPGYQGIDQSEQRLRRAASDIGYPILLKAVMGGGGKAIKAVKTSNEFETVLRSVQREARDSFSSDQVLIEKLIARPRHIEIQIFGDSQGNYVHFFERDCSLQRRHQKVIEEAPAPDISDRLRSQIAGTALDAARAIKYENAGTVEFLLDPQGKFYFMEMNTRLQVEHPITEMITGQDLVEWQIRVAAGEPLPLKQNDLKIEGHAIEARLYAEDPVRNFLPSPGTIYHLRFPTQSRNIRIDSGCAEGHEISPHYDPMIAKVIAWSATRDSARRSLISCLGNTEIAGITVNRDFLIKLVELDEFINGKSDTELVDRIVNEGSRPTHDVPFQTLTFSYFHYLSKIKEINRKQATNSNEPNSPWSRDDGWRLNGPSYRFLQFRNADKKINIESYKDGESFDFFSGKKFWKVRNPRFEGGIWLAEIDGKAATSRIIELPTEEIVIFGASETWQLSLCDNLSEEADTSNFAAPFLAPMSGRIVEVNVAEDAVVCQGDVLVVLEAMKMEHSIKAPSDGVVTAVHYGVGTQVNEGAQLIEFQEN